MLQTQSTKKALCYLWLKLRNFSEWDEVAHHHREDEGIDPENEIATEIDEDDGREKGDEGISEITIEIYKRSANFSLFVASVLF